MKLSPLGVVNRSLGETEKIKKAFLRSVHMGLRFLEMYLVLCISMLSNWATTYGSLDLMSTHK